MRGVVISHYCKVCWLAPTAVRHRPLFSILLAYHALRRDMRFLDPLIGIDFALT